MVLNQEDNKILEKACFYFRYIHGDFSETENNIHSTKVTEMKMKRGDWRKFPLLSYLLEVVNRYNLFSAHTRARAMFQWRAKICTNMLLYIRIQN